jgi:serine/threonine-protein kinase HipA
MKDIKVNINNQEVGNLFFEKEKNQYGFNYIQDFKPMLKLWILYLLV